MPRPYPGQLSRPMWGPRRTMIPWLGDQVGGWFTESRPPAHTSRQVLEPTLPSLLQRVWEERIWGATPGPARPGATRPGAARRGPARPQCAPVSYTHLRAHET